MYFFNQAIALEPPLNADVVACADGGADSGNVDGLAQMLDDGDVADDGGGSVISDGGNLAPKLDAMDGDGGAVPVVTGGDVAGDVAAAPISSVSHAVAGAVTEVCKSTQFGVAACKPNELDSTFLPGGAAPKNMPRARRAADVDVAGTLTLPRPAMKMHHVPPLLRLGVEGFGGYAHQTISTRICIGFIAITLLVLTSTHVSLTTSDARIAADGVTLTRFYAQDTRSYVNVSRHPAVCPRICANSLTPCGQRIAAPPFFHASGCPHESWTVQGAGVCLGSRRVFFIGNSVMRHIVFHASQFLSGIAPGWEVNALLHLDKQACPRSIKSCVFPTPQGGALHFAWLNALGSKPPGDDYKHAYDEECSDNVTMCVLQFLNVSRDGDVLLFMLGLEYAWEGDHIIAASNASAGGFDGAMKTVLLQWVHSINSAWHGRLEHIFRLTVPPLCDGGTNCGTREHIFTPTFVSDTNAHIARFNAIADSVLSLTTRWSAIDSWGLVERAQEEAFGSGDVRFGMAGYYDLVHFTEKITLVIWDVLLSSLCTVLM